MQALAPTDPEGRFIETANGPVHLVEEGPEDGTPILLFHGIPGSSRDFRYLSPELAAAGMRVFRIDAPGFGKTPWESFPHPEQAARGQWVENLLDVMGLEKAMVGGHSFGGTTALTAAALHPERIVGLLLICAPGLRRHQGLQFLPPSLVKFLAKGFEHRRTRALLDAGMRAAYRKARFKTEDLSATDMEHHALLVGNLDFRTQRWAAREVQCPTFVFSGGHDPLVEKEISFHLADALADQGRMRVEHHHFRKEGHYLQKEQAPFMAQVIKRAIGNGLAD